MDNRMHISKLTHSVVLGLASSIVFAVPPAGAQHSQCLGQINEPHPHGVFDFDTNSRLDPTTLGFYKFAIIPCVKNNKANWLQVRWPIPGLFGWVPPDVTKYWLPKLVKDDNVFQLRSCLQYGNRGDTTHASTLGTGEDKDLVRKEEQHGCRATLARADLPKEGVIERLNFMFREYIPSDSTAPEKSMLQVHGTVGIFSEPKAPDRYTSFVQYQVTPYPGSVAVEGMTIRPSFAGAAEKLLPLFNEKNPSVIKLDEQGNIQFHVSGVTNPVLTYAAYDFFDRKGERVGSLSVPVFVSR